MDKRKITLVAFVLSGFWVTAPADEPHEQREAMEVGGLLTVDGANKFKDWQNTPAQLGSMELSAIVHVDSNMEGSITLLSESDPEHIVVDQAVGQWTLAKAKIIFGQQGFNLGLLSTRTISDPLMLDLGEFRQAGVTGLMYAGLFTYGFGLSSLSTTGPDSTTTSDPCVILNADFTPEGQLARLALQASRARQAVDAGLNLTHGTWMLDAEALWRWKDEDDIAKTGFSAGIAWQALPMFQPAVRWDGIGDENDPVANQMLTLGITVSPIDHLFGAAEMAVDQDGEPYFALQMGLQSTLKLPGFQRNTLTK